MDELDLLKMLFQLAGGISDEPLSRELQKLDAMLTEAGIPFENYGTQICYYGREGRQESEMDEGCIWRGRGVDAICSVISNGYGSRE